MQWLKYTVLFFLVLSSICFGSNPDTYLEQKISPILKLINSEAKKTNSQSSNQLVDQLTVMVLPIVDEKGISKAVTGKYWSTASADMQSKFSNKFVRLIIKSFIAYITAGEGVSAKYRPVSDPNQKRVTVSSQVKFSNGEKWRVDYLVTESNGVWMIQDIILDGLSLVSSYREQFKPILEEKGFSGLYQLVSQVAG